jgi:hypothetical protein
MCSGGRWRSQDAAPGPASECLVPTHGQAPCSPIASSTSGGAYTGLDPFVGHYIHTTKLVWGIPVVMSILWPSVGALSSSSSAAFPDQDSSDDYPETRMSTCGDSFRVDRLIFMVALNGDPSHHSYSRYHTIGRSEASDARTPNTGMIRNLNLDFNAARFQTIIESI